MIDTFSILLSHILLFLLCWRLLSRPDLDREKPSARPRLVDAAQEVPVRDA